MSEVTSTCISHGTHDGTIVWVKYEPADVNNPNGVQVTLVHLDEGPTLRIYGTYSFRVGAHYQFHLIGGNMVTATIVKKRRTE